MNTITKTTASAISRKLTSLGFLKLDGTIGFEVYTDNDSEKSIYAAHRVYDNGQPDTFADELYRAGYEVETVVYRAAFSWNAPGVVTTTVRILGRVEA